MELFKVVQVHILNFGGWQGRRTLHVPHSLQPRLIFTAKFKMSPYPPKSQI